MRRKETKPRTCSSCRQPGHRAPFCPLELAAASTRHLELSGERSTAARLALINRDVERDAARSKAKRLELIKQRAEQLAGVG